MTVGLRGQLVASAVAALLAGALWAATMGHAWLRFPGLTPAQVLQAREQALADPGSITALRA